jgi:hypothetical protein
MMRAPGPAAGKRLLFWDEKVDGGLGILLDALGVVPGGRRHGQPRDHVRRDVPRADREELARALQIRSSTNPTGGDVLMGYMGWADCRMCGARLGTRDLFGHGFVWPELAEHYVLVHDVWTPECAELLAVLRRAPRRTP